MADGTMSIAMEDQSGIAGRVICPGPFDEQRRLIPLAGMIGVVGPTKLQKTVGDRDQPSPHRTGRSDEASVGRLDAPDHEGLPAEIDARILGPCPGNGWLWSTRRAHPHSDDCRPPIHLVVCKLQSGLGAPATTGLAA